MKCLYHIQPIYLTVGYKNGLLVSNIFGTDYRTKTIKITFETTLEANLLDQNVSIGSSKCYHKVQHIFLFFLSFFLFSFFFFFFFFFW